METTDLDAPPKSLVEIITEIALSEGWVETLAEAREKAEYWHDDTLSRLQTEASKLKEMGRPVRIDFNSSSVYLIQGACFIERKDSEELRERKLRRLRSSTYFEAFSHLSPVQLELLCGKLLMILGVKNPKVSRASADEGIDFYGVLSLESIFFPRDLTPTIQKQLKIWLIGQAKHYKKIQSGTSEIRDLAGALNLGRAKAFGSRTSPFPDLNIRVGDPVFAMLITTGTFSSNAWRLLSSSGIIGMDGEMLAAFLADRGVGVKDQDFDLDTFLEWLR